MATKYYTAHNAGRPIAGQQFEITEIQSGTAIGVFQTEDETLQVGLDAEVAKNRGVEEVSQAVYDSSVKKKAPSLVSLPHSNQPGLKVSLSYPVGVVVPEGIQEDHTDQTRLESVEGALDNLGEVAPAKPVE
jgi:hypothetical protein